MPMSITDIREAAAHLNNPGVSVEDRQRALTSLFVEFIDRMGELQGATGAAIGRLTRADEAQAEAQAAVLELLRPVAVGAADAEPPTTEVGTSGAPGAVTMAPTTVVEAPAEIAEALAASAAAAAKKPSESPVTGRKGKPQPVPNPAVATSPVDAASIAAGMNGSDKTPVAPIASVKTAQS